MYLELQTEAEWDARGAPETPRQLKIRMSGHLIIAIAIAAVAVVAIVLNLPLLFAGAGAVGILIYGYHDRRAYRQAFKAMREHEARECPPVSRKAMRRARNRHE